MRTPRLSVLAALLVPACAGPGAPAKGTLISSAPAAHYHEAAPDLSAHEASWRALYTFFGDAMPPSIEIVHIPSGNSYFDPDKDVVYLSPDRGGQSEKATVAHETSHLALARLTHKVSTDDAFRFLDEGLASIWEERIEGTAASHEARVMAIAAARMTTGSVKLADLQIWHEYFGKPTPNGAGADFVAYDVGAAFDYFVIGSFGEEKFKALLVDVGRTRSFATSAQNVLGVSASELEARWRAALGRVTVKIPAAIEMNPPNGAVGVPTTTSEISVQFDVPMKKSIRVMTDCDGICYDHAFWKDERTLAIRIDRTLLPHHTYALTLGTKRGKLTSKAGVEAPLVRWEFETQ